MPGGQTDLLTPLNSNRAGAGASARRTGSTVMAAVSLFKAVVGTGVFAYPPAVREAGWVLATAVACFFFVINLYTMALLNLAIVAMRQKGFGADSDGRVEYHQLTAHIFTRPTNAVFLVVAVLGQVLTLASMTVFVVDQIVPLAPSVHEWQVALGMAVIVSPLCCLRTTDALPFQMSMQLGSVAVLTGMVTLLWYGLGPHGGFDAAEIEGDSRVEFRGLATAFSISAMMYSAHMESVSIEQDMVNRPAYLRTLVTTQAGIGLLYMGFGCAVYFCFGTATGRICSDPTDGSIGASSLVCRDWQDVTVFQNIPPGVFFTTVKLAVSINLVMMYPVTMLPASKAIEEALGIKTIIPSIALRLCIIGSMTVTGMALPSFEFLQALTGSLTMFTALSMPPYAYWLLCKDEMGAAHNLWAWFVLVFGLACTVFSTAQTIYNKVEPSG